MVNERENGEVDRFPNLGNRVSNLLSSWTVCG